LVETRAGPPSAGPALHTLREFDVSEATDVAVERDQME
jgi:hypothetical protein